MPLSIRLDKETEDVLKKATEYLSVTRSQIIRESLREYCKKIIEEKTRIPWEIYQSIHRAGGSGHGKRVLMSREILKEKLGTSSKKWLS